MGKNLNSLEHAILEEIARYNGEEYYFVKDHLPYLRVKSRKRTGVGVYVNFEYLPNNDSLDFNDINAVLSSDKSLVLDVLKYSLNYELNITNGRMEFLEFVTNGESWNGNYTSFKLVS